MKLYKFFNIFIPTLMGATIIAVPTTIAVVESQNIVPQPVPPGPVPPTPTEEIILDKIGYITRSGSRVLPYVYGDEMDILANTEYKVKISMNIWSDFIKSWPYKYWYFGFGKFGELSSITGANVISSLEKNKMYVNDVEITNGLKIEKLSTIDINIFLTQNTPIYENDIVTAKMVFAEPFENGNFAMFPGL